MYILIIKMNIHFTVKNLEHILYMPHGMNKNLKQFEQILLCTILVYSHFLYEQKSMNLLQNFGVCYCHQTQFNHSSATTEFLLNLRSKTYYKHTRSMYAILTLKDCIDLSIYRLYLVLESGFNIVNFLVVQTFDL